MTEPAIKKNSHWWTREDLILLALLGVLFLFPGLGLIPLFDRDEPRFATAARTMAETGNYIVPRFNGALRPDKPPLVYWLMDVGYAATGSYGELGARLPSAICGILTLLVIYGMVGSRFGRLTGFISAMMLGSSALFLVESRFATADGTMLLFIVICMACAWQAWDAGGNVDEEGETRKSVGHLPRTDYLLDRSGDKSALIIDHLPASRPCRMPLGLAMVFWVSLAAGTLTKGVPLIFVLVPMAALSICTGQLPAQLRRWRSHFHLTRVRVGVAFAIAAALSAYLIAVGTAHVLPDSRLWVAVAAVLLVGMMLTPGLPGVLARCVAGGNWGWWRQLRPLVGIPLLIILVGWWVVWAGVATDWKLIDDMVGIHFLSRVAGPLFNALGIHLAASGDPTKVDPLKSYGQPPGFYLLAVWGTFWPWSILLVPAAYHTFRRLRGKTAIAIDPRPYQFLVAWIVPMWILLELARGKLVHYPLPLYVGMSILCADTLVQSWHRLTDVLAAKWFEVMRWGMLLIWAGMGIAVLVAAVHFLEPESMWRCVPFAAALLATGFTSAMTWGKPSWPYVLVLSWGGALLIPSLMILPDFPMLQVSRVAGHKMAELKKDDPGIHLAARGYQEGTLVFYAGSNVEMFASVKAMLEKVKFDTANDAARERYVIAVDDDTLKEMDSEGVKYAEFNSFPRISGLDTGSFKPVDVTLITNIPSESATTTAPLPSASAPATTTLPERSSH